MTFANFISHYHMDAREIYGKFSFARLMVWARVREDFNEPAEEVLTKACSRIVAIDSRRWIESLLDIWFDCPLDAHCTYTARQILTAFDDEKVMSFREGVKWLPAKNTDVLLIDHAEQVR